MSELVKHIASLIIKQRRGELSYEEEAELEQWAGQSAENRALLEELMHDETLQQHVTDYQEGVAAKDAIWKKIEESTREEESDIPLIALQAPRRKTLYYFIAAAATTAVVLTGVLYFGRHNNRQPVQPPVAQTINDVLPGGNKAILTLSDGRKIVLNDAANGMLTKEGSTAVSKTQDGQIKYTAAPLATNHSPLADPERSRMGPLPLTYNTLSTPHGGQFQLVLPDGSHVWLNAASSITYPTAFVGNERRVQIIGEAYFEVAKNKAKPFIVSVLPPTGGTEGGRGLAEIEVLGTHFNVNAYTDESNLNTTLLEGSIRLTVNGKNQTPGSKILSPGQQATLNKEADKLSIKHIDEAESSISWIKGVFHFEKADIKTVMRQLSRWYDVDIVYEGKLPEETIMGDAERNIPLSRMLMRLEKMTSLHFQVQGRTIKVTQ